MVFTIINKKIKVLQTRNYLWHSTPGISENARKKVNFLGTLNSKTLIQLKSFFFDLQKFNISIMPERGQI